MIPVIGLGAGGHGKVVLEILQLMGGYELVGLLDPNSELWRTKLLDVPILGGDDLLPELRDRGINKAFIGLGTVGDVRPREKLYKILQNQQFEIVSAVHPQTIIAPSVQIGYGITIMAGVIVNSSVKFGNNVIVNSGAIVEHDCIIGSHVHIAPGAKLAGTVQVGAGSHIGIGAVIAQGIRIGNNAIIGAGAVVIKDVPDSVVVVGVPARILKQVGT